VHEAKPFKDKNSKPHHERMHLGGLSSFQPSSWVLHFQLLAFPGMNIESLQRLFATAPKHSLQFDQTTTRLRPDMSSMASVHRLAQWPIRSRVVLTCIKPEHCAMVPKYQTYQLPAPTIFPTWPPSEAHKPPAYAYVFWQVLVDVRMDQLQPRGRSVDVGQGRLTNWFACLPSSCRS
jgi:hypothetical protein